MGEREVRRLEVESAARGIAERGTLHYDAVARRQRRRPPLWFDLLRWLHTDAPVELADHAAERLEPGGFEPEPTITKEYPQAEASLQRIAALARAAYGRGPGVNARNLEETLLLDAFAAHPRALDPFEPPVLADAERVELPVLFVDQSQSAGVVVTLRLWRIDTAGHDDDRLRLVRAPASQLLQLDPDPRQGGFQQSLDHVRTFLHHQPGLAGIQQALVWDLTAYDGTSTEPPPLFGLGGGSLGAAFGLGALYLLREHLTDTWRGLLEGIDWQKAAISAQLIDGEGRLGPVGGLPEKIAEWQRVRNGPSAVFVHEDQRTLGNIELPHARTLFGLLERVAAHASDMTEPQALLYRRLQRLPLDQQLVDPEDRKLLVAVAQGGEVKGMRGYLLHRYAECAVKQKLLFPQRDTADARSDLRFVNLKLVAQEGFDPTVGPSRFDSLQQMLASLEGREGVETIRRVDIWQIRAEPGAGKSTVLRHHQATQSHRALADWPAWSRQDRPPLCIEVLVAGLPEQAEFGTWLRDAWRRQYSQLPTLDECLGRYRVRFIIDGLNEIRPGPGTTVEDRVQGIVDWLDRLDSAALDPPILTVRTLEATHGLEGRQHLLHRRDATLERWKIEDIQAYCGTWTERAAGQRLLAAIGREPLRDLCALPLNLAAQCEMLAAGVLAEPARDRGELFSALLWARLRREFEQVSLKGQLSKQDRRAISEFKGRGMAPGRRELIELPLGLEMLDNLRDLACKLVGSARGTWLTAKEWHPLVPEGEAAREAWLTAATALGVVELLHDGSLRFQHQNLWQEYFAAQALVLREQSQWPDLAAGSMTPIEEARKQALNGGAPLRHTISVWEEPVKLAVQLDAKPARWIEHLMGCNLGLAGRAAALCRTALSDELLGRLRQQLIRSSMDPAVDLRLRVEAGLALGEVGDPRYIDGRADQSTGNPCLVLKDDLWFTVPKGAYIIGSEEGLTDEQPLTEVELDEFQIAWAPVTNAEFRCFIEDGGYENPNWWSGEAASRWQQGKTRQDYWVQKWSRRFALLQAARSDEDFEAVRQDEFSHYPKQSFERHFRPMADWSDEEARAWIELWYGEHLRRQPASWNDSEHNAAAQPVVGVSLYEARAYARWLSAQSSGRWAYRLPRLAELEVVAHRAATSTDFVSSPPDDEAFNHFAAGVLRTSPAGVFGGGQMDAPTDLLGNVWEWTVSRSIGSYTRDDLLALDDDFDPSDPRIVRSGSWYHSAHSCRDAFGFHYQPGVRYYNSGCRLVRCHIHGSVAGHVRLRRQCMPVTAGSRVRRP